MREDVQRFYDGLWKVHAPDYGPSRRHLLELFEPNEIEGKRVLDAGCGCGIFSSIFAELGASLVVPFDMSRSGLEAARSIAAGRGVDVHPVRGDLLRLPFADGSFDVVWAWGSIHHTTDPLKAMEEVVRVLSPGGRLLVALYKKTGLTFLHEAMRRCCCALPSRLHVPLSRVMAVALNPVVRVFKRREKVRQGEKLEHLILDWFFIPVRHHFDPDWTADFFRRRGMVVEKYVPASGRFDSTSNFIYRLRKE